MLGLIGPVRDLVGPESTGLEAAMENTGSLGLRLKNHIRMTPAYKPASVERWLAFDHPKPGNSIGSAAFAGRAASSKAGRNSVLLVKEKRA